MFGRKAKVPQDWEARAAVFVPDWERFSGEDRDAFADALAWALQDISWDPVAGFALDDDMRLTLALPVALMTLGLHPDHLRACSTLVVWPEAIERRPDPVPLLDYLNVGAARFPLRKDPNAFNGPLALSYAAVADDVAHPERGRNAVLRTLAIAIDVADEHIDGTPTFDAETDRDAWIEVATPIFEALEAGTPRPPIDASAAEDAVAFFGAVTEAFFLRGAELQANEPALYDLLVAFYAQDPASRAPG